MQVKAGTSEQGGHPQCCGVAEGEGEMPPRSGVGVGVGVGFLRPHLIHRKMKPAAAGHGVRLTVSDSELASRGFAVRRTPDGLDVSALNEVFARVGFPRRQEERLRRALEHSEVVWLAAAGEERRPVAFARAAGDGVFNAVVWDVVVEPSCQGLGLGRAVMERLVAELRRKGVANIVLYAEPRVVGFYRLLGFAMDPDGIRGMAYYRRNKQPNSS